MSQEIYECAKCNKLSVGNHCQFCYDTHLPENRQLALRSRLDND